MPHAPRRLSRVGVAAPVCQRYCSPRRRASAVRTQGLNPAKAIAAIKRDMAME